MFKKTLHVIVIVCFAATFIAPLKKAEAESLVLPQPGTMVNLSPAFSPVLIKGIKIHPDNPLLFDFIIDTGHTGFKAQQQELRQETEKLIKYFLATMTIPENELWVNLSPYEKDRIIPETLGQTEMGRDMLAQDYILKQLTASLIYPEKELGKEFWNRVYSLSQQRFGKAQVPVNTFNKVWIMADKAKIYVHDNTAFVVASHLKVMLDKDYLALKKNQKTAANTKDVTSDIVREIVLPEIEKEVNTGKNFANLRQVYQSMILATWYKNNLKEALLNQVYTDKSKLNGVTADDKAVTEKIYAQYLEAYKKGVFNYIKDDPASTTPRKYFSGGAVGLRAQDVKVVGRNDADFAMFAKTGATGDLLQATAAVEKDAAMKAVLPRVNPTLTRSWNVLADLARYRTAYDLRKSFFNDPQRAERYLKRLNPGFEVDLSRNLIDDKTMGFLLNLAGEVDLGKAIEQMFTGEKINETEQRAVLHTALRNVKRDTDGKLIAASGPVYVDNQDVMPEVIKVLEKIESFTKEFQPGPDQRRGASGRKIKNVINVGIGGSDLGARMAVEALEPFKVPGGVNAYFLSNIDGTAAARLMRDLDPKETLVIVASKTFTTDETITNANTLKTWMLNAYQDNKQGIKPETVIKKHFVAVSTATEKVKAFGIDTQNMFAFWDWVGGRYSVWSAIGLPLAIYIGFDNFLEFLQGGREADEHFRNTSFLDNIPVLQGLLDVWYGNHLGARSLAILPYDEYLGLFPKFSQQFFMESQGKRADRSSNPIDYPTGMDVFGAAGTDAQHSFMQKFHQQPVGTIVPIDFIAVRKTHNPLPGHHPKFFANVVAQAEALATGLTREEALKAMKDAGVPEDVREYLAEHKTFPGNRPSTMIEIDQVTPRTLGSLIALYEHRIFVESMIWNIFPNDQWGVELGKQIASKQVLPSILGSTMNEKLTPAGQRAIARFKQANGLDAANQAMTAYSFSSEPLRNKDGRLNYVFGTSGIRMSVEALRQQTPRIAQATAEYLKEIGADSYVLGRDTRHGNLENIKKAAAIMAANGIKVFVLGDDNLQGSTPTPVVALMSQVLQRKGLANKLGGSGNFTASHNPKDDNGFKHSAPDGGAAPKKITDAIAAKANQEDMTAYLLDGVDFEDAYQKGIASGNIVVISSREILDEYVGYFVSSLQAVKDKEGQDLWTLLVDYVKNTRDLFFIYDAMQGTSGAYAQAILERIAQEAGVNDFYAINHKEPSSDFEQVNGKPNVEPFVKTGVTLDAPTGKNTVVFSATDGDADRVFWAYENGSGMTADDTMALMTYYMKTMLQLDDYDAVVKTMVTSNMVSAVVKFLKLNLYDTPVGFKYIVDWVRVGKKVLMGGETSLHIGAMSIFKDTWDDAIAMAFMQLVFKASLNKKGLPEQTVSGYWNYVKAQVLKPGEAYVKFPADEPRDQVTWEASTALIREAYKQIDAGRKPLELDIVKITESLLMDKYGTAGLDVPKVSEVHIQYAGPEATERDGVQLVLSNGDRFIVRPSGTEPVAKGVGEVLEPNRAKALESVIRSLTAFAKKEYEAGMLKLDAAMSTAEEEDDYPNVDIISEPLRGGIDLNAKNLDMNVSGGKVSLRFDPAMIEGFKRGDFSGVHPVIINITPIPAILPLLGLKDEDANLAKV